MNSKKVLIIEDDKDLLEIETQQLQNAGFQVFTSQKAEEAIQMLNSNKFDCLLLDMNLQSSSGKEIIDKIKVKNHLNCNTPIVIASGSLNIEVIKQVKEKVCGVLIKPFNSNDLCEKISKAMKIAHMSRVSKKIGPAKKVFIVDDDVEYLNELKNFLEGENFKVVASTNSHEAAAKLQNQKFDIILTDLEIDQHNGEWLVNLLRKDHNHLNYKTPIIIISGFVNFSSPKLSSMVQQIVEKPIPFSELTQKIQQQVLS